MKQIIDIDTWERKDNFSMFTGFLSCWYSMTTEVDCTAGYASARKSGRSFFVYYLYAILRAVNEVKEMRYRLDKEGRVVLYDAIDVLVPVAVPGRTFFTVRIKYTPDFEQFYHEARAIIDNIQMDGDPYGVNKRIMAEGEYNVFNLSATPKLYFTSISYTLVKPGCSQNFPLMNVGKAVKRDGRLVMPIAFTFSHQFVDGAHIQAMVEKIEQYLNSI